MITSFFHTGFVVRNLEKAMAFYRDVIGLEVVREPYDVPVDFGSQLSGYPEAQMRIGFLQKGPGHQLELIQYVNPTGEDQHHPKNSAGAIHLCFKVEQIETVRDSLIKRGLKEAGSIASRRDPTYGSVAAFYGRDPEGNWLEFVARDN